MSDSRIFLASSPRHLLLFAGLAVDAGEADNRLWFIEHVAADAVATYLDMIRRWPASPFGSVEALAADYRPLLNGKSPGESRKALKRRFRAQNRATIDTALAARAADAVFVGVDDFFEAQFLLHRSAQLNPGRRGVYVEDGVSCYEHSYQRTHIRNIPKEWLRAVRYFPWWRPSPLPGASSWLSEGFVAWPDLVLEPFRRKQLNALAPERFLTPAMRELAGLMAGEFGVDVARLRQCDVVIAVTHSKWGRLLPGYRETMQHICRELLAAGKRVAIKPHPRDPEQNLLDLPDDPRLYRVPGGVMFEVLAMLIDSPELIVVGDASTSLSATKWLRPDAEVLALRHDPDGIDGNYLQQLFDGIGVRTVSDPGALTAYCLDSLAGEPPAATGPTAAAS